MPTHFNYNPHFQQVIAFPIMLKFIRSGLSQPLEKKKKFSKIAHSQNHGGTEQNQKQLQLRAEQLLEQPLLMALWRFFLLKTRYGIIELTHVNSVRCKIMKGGISISVKATWNGGTVLSGKLCYMGTNWPHSYRCKQGFLLKQVRAFRSLSPSLSSRASKSEQNSAENPGPSSASQSSAFLQ